MWNKQKATRHNGECNHWKYTKTHPEHGSYNTDDVYKRQSIIYNTGETLISESRFKEAVNPFITTLPKGQEKCLPRMIVDNNIGSQSTLNGLTVDTKNSCMESSGRVNQRKPYKNNVQVMWSFRIGRRVADIRSTGQSFKSQSIRPQCRNKFLNRFASAEITQSDDTILDCSLSDRGETYLSNTGSTFYNDSSGDFSAPTKASLNFPMSDKSTHIKYNTPETAERPEIPSFGFGNWDYTSNSQKDLKMLYMSSVKHAHKWERNISTKGKSFDPNSSTSDIMKNSKVSCIDSGPGGSIDIKSIESCLKSRRLVANVESINCSLESCIQTKRLQRNDESEVNLRRSRSAGDDANRSGEKRRASSRDNSDSKRPNSKSAFWNSGDGSTTASCTTACEIPKSKSNPRLVLHTLCSSMDKPKWPFCKMPREMKVTCKSEADMVVVFDSDYLDKSLVPSSKSVTSRSSDEPTPPKKPSLTLVNDSGGAGGRVISIPIVPTSKIERRNAKESGDALPASSELNNKCSNDENFSTCNMVGSSRSLYPEPSATESCLSVCLPSCSQSTVRSIKPLKRPVDGSRGITQSKTSPQLLAVSSSASELKSRTSITEDLNRWKTSVLSLEGVSLIDATQGVLLPKEKTGQSENTKRMTATLETRHESLRGSRDKTASTLSSETRGSESTDAICSTRANRGTPLHRMSRETKKMYFVSHQDSEATLPLVSNKFACNAIEISISDFTKDPLSTTGDPLLLGHLRCCSVQKKNTLKESKHSMKVDHISNAGEIPTSRKKLRGEDRKRHEYLKTLKMLNNNHLKLEINSIPRK